MNSRILFLALLATLSLAVVDARGANIVLRERAEYSGAVVYLSDVADISAETPSEVQILSATPLLPAPAQGTQEFLRANQIRELLISRGIDVSVLLITGSNVVEISNIQETPTQVEPVAQLDPEEIENAVRAAINRYLTNETGHQTWQVELSLSAANMKHLNNLGAELSASAGHTPWTGNQRFEIIASSATKAVAVYAKVDRLQDTVVAVRNIQQGDLIGIADVEVRLQGGNLPTATIGSLGEVLGKEALRPITPETILQRGQLRSPLQVQRGETVEVYARTGGITVKTFAVVKQDGSLGDLVQVETLDRKEKFAARVSGWKQLDVLPTGVSAADIATLHSSTREQR